MESANEPRLQLLFLSKDPTHMERITSMLHGHGIQTMTERTSLPWRSAGYESFVMVSTEDYPEASALCLDPDMAGASTGISHFVTTQLMRHGSMSCAGNPSRPYATAKQEWASFQ
jgi:hypothetical protein